MCPIAVFSAMSIRFWPVGVPWWENRNSNQSNLAQDMAMDPFPIVVVDYPLFVG